MADIQIHGLRELRRKLLALSPKIAKKHLQKATNKGIDHALTVAKAIAPYDESREEGRHMRDFIRKRNRRSRSRFEAATSIGVVTAKNASQDQTGAYYWTFVEFGTSKMRAQPFIRPAFELTKFAQVSTVAGYLRKALKAETNAGRVIR